ncbi:carboxylesterase/lipase family protein [Pseudomonas sp. Gutcm_11s]|uniref:carboxylesterase/lipase family protein n=1 Tax=Pseudomonas sp. Gutcm_11s TaxID=3026088 RepID=UPI00235FE7A2|nr:carboxylesterase family protein [Pseudomonas sp. Gutcm_11s]MDD0841454.1 carboxylesterase family protein [Pseudomonas sp. Gutcm_11s]
MKIRNAAALGALLASLGASTGLIAKTDCETCTQVDSGAVKGHQDGEVLSFKGIPYAAAPTGELRFRPPQAVQPWSGVLDAAKFRSTCPQVQDVLEEYPYPGRVVKLKDGQEHEVYESEDCLHLNVWTPKIDNAKRPIMVFIPGGAFIVGNGSSDFYNGKKLASHDVVVVTLNYRVGLFGFMELGGVDKRYAGSGNNGLRDQIAAIEWVKRNAASFGGDPDNITIFGESAGGASVNALLSIKSPEKLFKRAIAQSGHSNMIHTKEFAVSSGQEIVKIGGYGSIDEVLKATPLELLETQEAAFREAAIGDLLFAPFIDGTTIVGEPHELIKSGHAKAIDLMAGATQNELNYWSLYDSKLRNPFTDETDAGPATPPIPDELRAEIEKKQSISLDGKYAKLLGESNHSVLRQAQNDDFGLIQPLRQLADNQHGNNANTYLYRFAWKVPTKYLPEGSVDLGSVHALELPFMFGTMDLGWMPGGEKVGAESRGVDLALSKHMMAAWTNFARSGNPNGPGVPEWKPYDNKSHNTMVWNEQSKTVADPDSERRQIWQDVVFGSLF